MSQGFAGRAAVVCLVLVAYGHAACDEGLLAPSSIDDLTGGPWRLQSIEAPGGGPAPVEDPTRFTLQFQEQGRVAVRADCNRCTGSYTLAGANLAIRPLACTRASCPSAPLDTDYVAVLSGDSQAAVLASALRLSSARGTLRFTR